jgi:protein involved in polysaccharide export with SLBB domain
MKMNRSLVFSTSRRAQLAAALCALFLVGAPHCTSAQTQTQSDTNPMNMGEPTIANPTGQGPVTLRQPTSASNGKTANGNYADRFVANRPEPYVPSEFERYVQGQAAAQSQFQSQSQSQPQSQPQFQSQGQGQGQNQAQPGAPGQEIRRFGANLLTDPVLTSSDQDPLPSVPGDYIIKPGDEIALTIWGSVDADLRLTVDRSGLISVPRIGAITVAGLRYDDLANTVTRRASQIFKNFQLTATMGQVRSIRVYVSGYARHPGSITVSGLASVLNALMRAGGPSTAGSFRDIRLSRGGHQIATFDLYDLLLKGTRAADQLLQADDVIFIGPVGTQAALIGSVNQQAVFELNPGETLADMINMAGGFTAVADRTRVTIERLADRNQGRVSELLLPAQENAKLATGDVVRAYSGVASALPRAVQNNRVHIDGEVVHPGDYVLPPGSMVSDALRAAGGLTSAAFPYGTEFTRESVRLTQQVNFDRALRDLETDMVKNQATQRSTSIEETATQNAQSASNNRLIERLRQVRPTGRVVMPIEPDARSIPDFPLENGDTLTVPARGTSVGVFGSVFNTGSFVFVPNHTADDYLQLAGGPTRGADKPSIFMIRANGSVISAQQGASFWHSGNNLGSTIVQPGDTLFVPEELNKSTFIQDAKDWTQILYQFGLGVAGIKSLGL